MSDEERENALDDQSFTVPPKNGSNTVESFSGVVASTSHSDDKIIFENLHESILELILSYLTGAEISSVCTLNKTIYLLASKVLTKRFYDLKLCVYGSIQHFNKLLRKLPSRFLFQENELEGTRLPMFRSYFILEVLISEVKIIESVSRGTVLGVPGKTHVLGRLVDALRDVYMEAMQERLPRQDELTCKAIKLTTTTKLFLESCIVLDGDDPYFAARCIDVLDSSTEKTYDIKVLYYPLQHTCSIEAKYLFRNPPHLAKLPQLLEFRSPFMLSSTNKKLLLDYLIRFVKVNNGMLLIYEQRHRENEASGGSSDVRRRRLYLWLTREVRQYDSVLPNPSRSIRVVDDTYEIVETYTRENRRSPITADVHKELRFSVSMSCSMDSLPGTIEKCWNRLKHDVLVGSMKDSGEVWENLHQDLLPSILSAPSIDLSNTHSGQRRMKGSSPSNCNCAIPLGPGRIIMWREADSFNLAVESLAMPKIALNNDTEADVYHV